MKRVVRRYVPLPDWPQGGHFTAPCRAWFGPHWTPVGDWGRDEIAHADAAARGRATQLAAGHTGSMRGLSKASEASVRQYAQRNAKGQK